MDVRQKSLVRVTSRKMIQTTKIRVRILIACLITPSNRGKLLGLSEVTLSEGV